MSRPRSSLLLGQDLGIDRMLHSGTHGVGVAGEPTAGASPAEEEFIMWVAASVMVFLVVLMRRSDEPMYEMSRMSLLMQPGGCFGSWGVSSPRGAGLGGSGVA